MDTAYLPSPFTHSDYTAIEAAKAPKAGPRQDADVLRRQKTPISETVLQNSSPPGDTQVLSQFVYPPRAYVDEIQDEEADGVWGYLLPLDHKFGEPLVLKRRDNFCSVESMRKSRKSALAKQRENRTRKTSKTHSKHVSDQQSHPGGYLIGRHPECGK